MDKYWLCYGHLNIHQGASVRNLLFLERSRINDVSTGRRAINVSGGAAPLRQPYEHDLLYIESIHIDGYGCTASRLGEQGPPLSGIDMVGISLFYVGIPTALRTVLLHKKKMPSTIMTDNN